VNTRWLLPTGSHSALDVPSVSTKRPVVRTTLQGIPLRAHCDQEPVRARLTQRCSVARTSSSPSTVSVLHVRPHGDPLDDAVGFVSRTRQRFRRSCSTRKQTHEASRPLPDSERLRAVIEILA